MSAMGFKQGDGSIKLAQQSAIGDSCIVIHNCLARHQITFYILQMQLEIEKIQRQAPALNSKTPRMTDELKNLPVDLETAIRTDLPTALCLRLYAKRKGWKIVQQKEGDSILVWRVA